MSDKKTLQDVMPPKRSIQDIPIPESKNRKVARDRSERKSIGFFGASGDKKSKKLKKKLWFFVALLIVAVSLFFLLMSSKAVIKIIPKQLQQRVDTNFVAVSEKETGGIPFDIVMIDKIGSKEVVSTNEEMVQEKASGQIVIFNDFDKNTQRLIVNTRFETPDGLIYRVKNSVVVPGQTVGSDGKTLPGSVEATVYADQPGEEYNIGLSDFTIPGFEGTDRFDGFYARSKTAMVGGFEGVKKVASEADIEKARTEIFEELKQEVSQEILTKIPEDFVLFNDGLFVSSDFVGTVDSAETSEGMLEVQEKVSAYAVIFDRNNLSKQVASNGISNYKGEELIITNLEDLDFEIKNKEEVEPWVEGRFIFSLKGEANFEWLFDENELKNDFVGRSEDEINNILVNYSGIKSADVKITPFWKSSFPRSTSQIEITKQLGE